MFTIFIWDTERYQSNDKIENLSGNEKFLIPLDLKKYPLLGNLSSCEEDIFSNGLLVDLSNEVKELIIDFKNDTDIEKYLLNFLNLINKAMSLNKSILITPFLE